MPLSKYKEDKILIKGLQECKGYNAWQFITEFLNKGWKKNSINRLLVKFGTVDRRLGSGRRSAHTDETSIQLSRCCWVRKTYLRAAEQSEKFHVRWGVHRSSVSQIIHKDLRLKCYKKRRAQQLTEAHNMHALFSVCSLRDDNLITSKPTWKPKDANSIPKSSEYFCQNHQNWLMQFRAIPFSKLGRFLRQCSFFLAFYDLFLSSRCFLNITSCNAAVDGAAALIYKTSSRNRLHSAQQIFVFFRTTTNLGIRRQCRSKSYSPDTTRFSTSDRQRV